MYLPQDDQPVRHRSKKDRRNWCKGRVGISHEPVISDDPRGPYSATCGLWTYGVTYRNNVKQHSRYMCFHVIECKNCGRILKYMLTEQECPDSDLQKS
jgi:hypothetical protein